MSKLITAPDTERLEKLFKDDLTCRMVYGLEVCGAPAQYKIIMACCGGSDFLCAECLAEASRPQMPRGTLLKSPFMTVTDEDRGYFGCGLCSTMHQSWKAAVKETIRL
jgi:hypothetical protein